MQYVNLGRSGLKVSRICLGTMTYGDPKWRSWVLSEEASRPFIKRALEHGINFFDTADMYSRGASEEVVGRALRDFAKRDEIVLATKAYFPMSDAPNDRGSSRKHLLAGIDNSLRRLGTDYVDLYQVHSWDAETPIEDAPGPARHRPLGESALHRGVEHGGVAVHQGAVCRGPARLDALRVDAEPLQPRLP
jgi:aryl-alcohol dehydrogenase (NADP+)